MIIKNNKNIGDIVISGKVYNGKNIRIENSTIYVDGVKIELEDTEEKNIIIEKIENIQFIHITSINGDITINGDCNGNCESTNGDITIKGSVGGNCYTRNGDIIKKK